MCCPVQMPSVCVSLAFTSDVSLRSSSCIDGTCRDACYTVTHLDSLKGGVVETRFPVPSLCTYVKAMISVAKC